jgi:hypothetical protein
MPFLPEILSIILGAVSSPLTQLIKKAISERIFRFLISLGLSGLGGVAAFFMVKPDTIDLPTAIAWAFGASQLVYQFFSGIWVGRTR